MLGFHGIMAKAASDMQVSDFHWKTRELKMNYHARRNSDFILREYEGPRIL